MNIQAKQVFKIILPLVLLVCDDCVVVVYDVIGLTGVTDDVSVEVVVQSAVVGAGVLHLYSQLNVESGILQSAALMSNT